MPESETGHPRVLSPKEFDIRFRHAAHFLKKSLLIRLFCVVKCRRITRGKSGYPIQNSRFLDSAHRDLSPGMFTSALRFVARADRLCPPACSRPLYIFDLESITTRPTPDVLCGQLAFFRPGIEPNRRCLGPRYVFESGIGSNGLDQKNILLSAAVFSNLLSASSFQ